MREVAGPDASHAHVDVAGGPYPVFVERGLLDQLAELLDEYSVAHRYAVVSDDFVAPLYGERALEVCHEAGLDAALFTFPAGEASKTRKGWSILTDELLDAGFGRDSCIVAVGGGVTGDLAGFVAATFMRGVPVVQVPTSYLAMIDASVGGKTGVDVRAGKNLVGAFHAPDFVLADPDVLDTLPPDERVQGLVEAFKHGAILDADYFSALARDADALLATDPATAAAAVRRSVELKASVVTQDEREAGYRQVLNFGHTLGHALEAASSYSLGHGIAVAAGMLMEAELGERMGITRPGTREEIAAGLARIGVTDPVAPGVDVETAWGYLSTDKKTRRGRPRFVLLKMVGETDGAGGWSREVPQELVREVLAAGSAA